MARTWRAEKPCRSARNPDVADGRQHPTRMEIGLPEGVAQYRLPEYHRQNRDAHEHRLSRMAYDANCCWHCRRRWQAQIRIPLAASFRCVMADRTGFLSEASSIPVGPLSDRDDLRPVRSSFSEPGGR